jgi:hypothetical protein
MKLCGSNISGEKNTPSFLLRRAGMPDLSWQNIPKL